MASEFQPETRDWEWVCRTVLPRIGMWTGRISFDRTVAFIHGFDAAQPESILPTMNDRSEGRLGRRTALTWEAYVKADALDLAVDDLPPDEALSHEQHLSAIARLRSELMQALNLADPGPESTA